MRALRRITIGLLLMLAVAVAATALVLDHQGYKLFAVRTGSMTPTYQPGDLVVDAPLDGPVAAGDVITFRSQSSPDGVTTHRVHAVTAHGLQTKGDANRTADVATVPTTGVVGRVLTAVPNGGYVVVFLQQPAGVASVMTFTLSLLLSWGLFFPPAGGDGAPSAQRGRHSRSPAAQIPLPA